MSDKFKGSCHCRAVSYKFAKAPELTFYCHCNDCQKTTGSPFSMELMVDSASFEINGPTDSHTVTGDSGSAVHRWFCRNCGSGIYLESEADPGYVFIKVGSLNDANWVTPEMHIYTATKQPWINISDGLPQYETQPEV